MTRPGDDDYNVWGQRVAPEVDEAQRERGLFVRGPADILAGRRTGGRWRGVGPDYLVQDPPEDEDGEA